MSTHADPAFVAAEMAYRYERDHVTTTAARPRAGRSRLTSVWRRLGRRTGTAGVGRTITTRG